MENIQLGGAEPLNRANEVSELIDAVKSLIIPFISRADDNASFRASGRAPPSTTGTPSEPGNALIHGDILAPTDLHRHLQDMLPTGEGLGKDGLTAVISQILNHSVNTWDQGFMDKLYASTNAVGVVAECPGRLCSALTRQSRPPGIVEVLAYKVLYSIAAVSLPEVKTNARGSLS